MSKHGWTCSTCTFYHHAPAHNCVMCDNPRVTKAQMVGFILGKPIPDDSAASPTPKVAPESLAQKRIVPMIQNNNKDASKSKAKNSEPPAPKRSRPDNPYKKKAPSTQINGASTAVNNARPITNNKPPTAAMAKPMNPPLAASVPSRNTGGQQKTLTGAPAPPSTNAISRDNNKTTTNRKRNNDRSNDAKLPPPPPPVIHNAVYQPGPVPICPETAGEWIFPDDPCYPKRTYQFLMTQTALFHNTLVSLPTGLGKTLIASVVLYNYYRWFPTGKVIFLAPTLPLVIQQVKVRCACSSFPFPMACSVVWTETNFFNTLINVGLLRYYGDSRRRYSYHDRENGRR